MILRESGYRTITRIFPAESGFEPGNHERSLGVPDDSARLSGIVVGLIVGPLSLFDYLRIGWQAVIRGTPSGFPLLVFFAM